MRLPSISMCVIVYVCHDVPLKRFDFDVVLSLIISHHISSNSYRHIENVLTIVCSFCSLLRTVHTLQSTFYMILPDLIFSMSKTIFKSKILFLKYWYNIF